MRPYRVLSIGTMIAQMMVCLEYYLYQYRSTYELRQSMIDVFLSVGYMLITKFINNDFVWEFNEMCFDEFERLVWAETTWFIAEERYSDGKIGT